MRKTIRGAAALIVASALAASSIGVSAAGAAPAHPEKTSQTISLSARSHHHHYRHHYYHHHHGNGRAALRMFGAMVGMIGALAARDECRDYGGCYYGYGYPPPSYYYGPRYYRY